MRTRTVCDSCRQVYCREVVGTEQGKEQFQGLVTLSGLCPDCSRVLGKDRNMEP